MLRQINLLLVLALTSLAFTPGAFAEGEPTPPAEPEPGNADASNETTTSATSESDSRIIIIGTDPPIIIGPGPLDDLEAACKLVIDPEICESVFDIIDEDFLCPYDGGGVGQGLSPVVVNPGRSAYGVAGNAEDGMPGQYSGYKGHELVC